MVKKSFSDAESDKHAVKKYTIYHELLKHPGVTKLQMERNLGTVKPDISAYIGKYPVAIEIQVSPLSIDTILKRTAEYTAKGIYLLWLCSSYYVTGEYVPVNKWMRFLSGMYYGWMFYPDKDGMIIATKTKNSISDTSNRYLKTHRDVVSQSIKHLINDFKPVRRQAFADYPEANLWTIK